MRPSFPADLSCAAACALFVTAGVAFQAAPQAPPAAGSQSSAPAAPTGPAQFPPLGTGVSPEERATLQSAVDQLAARVTALKVKYRSGAMADRVADVEIYLDAVRRPLKYDERLYAPKGSAPAATALQTLATGTERAEQLARGTTPWMTVSGVRGFYSRIDGSAQPYILTMPDNYDAQAKRQYRLDLFLHGRDDTVLEQQFMTKSTTGYTSKPLGPGTDASCCSRTAATQMRAGSLAKLTVSRPSSLSRRPTRSTETASS